MLRAVLLLSVVAAAMAAICSSPAPHYGTFLGHPTAFKCPDGRDGQCVAAVMKLCGLGATSTWRRGGKVWNNGRCPNLAPNVPIATFQGPGNSYQGHAAIYLRCTSQGIVVADQWCNKPGGFSERTLRKDCTSVSNCADYFYTIL